MCKGEFELLLRGGICMYTEFIKKTTIDIRFMFKIVIKTNVSKSTFLDGVSL